jgi:hypothetical protein
MLNENRAGSRGSSRHAALVPPAALVMLFVAAGFSASPALADSSFAVRAPIVLAATGNTVSVACGDASHCEVLGFDTTSPTANVTTITDGAPGTTADLAMNDPRAIACADADTCYAIGTDSARRKLVQQVVGGTPQAAQTLPDPPKFDASYRAIACARSTCYAVGSATETHVFDPTEEGVVVPIVDGVVGDVQQVRDMQGLGSVACGASVGCYATGAPVAGGSASVVPIAGGVAGSPLPGDPSVGFDAATCVPASDSCYVWGTDSSYNDVIAPVTGDAVGSPMTVDSGGLIVQRLACPTTRSCILSGLEPASGPTDVGVAATDPANGQALSSQHVDSIFGFNQGMACANSTACYAAAAVLASGETTLSGLEGALLPITASQAATATTLTATPSSPLVRQNVVYKASVDPVPDGGTVAFSDGGSPIPGCGAVAITADGSASCATSYTMVGTHSISASYGGDAGFGESKSDPQTVDVTYAVGLLYNPDRTVRRGSALQLKLQLRDADGNDLSAPEVAVTADCIAPAGGAASCSAAGAIPLGQPFAYAVLNGAGPSYTYSLKTKSLAAGSYNVVFSAHGDPLTHAAPFTVR